MPGRYLLLFIWLFGCFQLAAQPYNSVEGRFQVDYVRGCSPLSIKVIKDQNTGVDPADQKVLQYGLKEAEAAGNPDFPEVKTTTFTINQPGTYWLYQLRGASGNEDTSFDSVRITAFEPTTPVFAVNNCGNGILSLTIGEDAYEHYTVYVNGTQSGSTSPARERTIEAITGTDANIRIQGGFEGAPFACGESSQTIQVWQELPRAQIDRLQANVTDGSALLEYSLQPNVRYQLEISQAGGGFQPVQEISHTTSLSLTGYDFAASYYCFRIATLNSCQGTAIASGEQLCTTAIQIEAESGLNNLKFSSQNLPNQEIQITNEQSVIFSSNEEFSGTFTDAVSCGENRCYTAQLASGTSVSTTSPFCIKNEQSGTPPSPANIISGWTSSTPYFIIADASAAFASSYILWDEIKATQIRQQTDSLLQLPEAGSCYMVQYSDGCKNISEQSRPVCPLFLQEEPNEPDVIRLFWNDFFGYADGVQEYQLERIAPDGSSAFISLGSSLTYEETGLWTEDNGTRFRIWALPVNTNFPASFSNEIIFDLVITGYFPNAFSPDGDGRNDSFSVMGKFVEQGELLIFDRWGRPIFQTNDIFGGWDGTQQGQDVPNGPYIYKASYQTTDGSQHTDHGSILLIRN